MSDTQEGQTTLRPKRGPLTYALWGVALIGAAAALYVTVHLFIKPAGAADLQSLAKGQMHNLTLASAGQPLPTTPFVDGNGHPLHLSDLKGKLMVVNLWATWCGPCVTEMPSLAKLQAAYPGKILVVPISMDKTPDREKARAFMAMHAPLPFYEDEQSAMEFALVPPAQGFPTTIIYDATGHERARVTDGADWSGPDAHAVFDALLKG